MSLTRIYPTLTWIYMSLVSIRSTTKYWEYKKKSFQKTRLKDLLKLKDIKTFIPQELDWNDEIRVWLYSDLNRNIEKVRRNHSRKQD